MNATIRHAVLTGCVGLVLASSAAQAAPVYDVQGGLLRGIQNLEVNGTPYTVTFEDGVVQAVYNLANPFTFTTALEAAAATLALSLAMQDVPQGNFDTDPLLTFGCAGDNCRLHVPYVFAFGSVSTEWFRNAANGPDDERGGADLLPTFNTVGTANVLTQWQVIPEPGSLALLGTGLALGRLARRRRAARAQTP